MKMRMLSIVCLAVLSPPGMLWAMETTQTPGASAVVTQPKTDAGVVSRVYQLKYCDAVTVLDVFRTMSPQIAANFVPDKRTNSLIVSATAEHHERVEDVLADLDRPSSGAPAGPMDVRVYHLQSARALKVAEILKAVTPPREVVVSANEQTNSIVVSAPAARRREIENLISELDTYTIPPQMMYRVYMLELPPEDPNLKAFTVVVENSTEFLADDIMRAIQDSHLQVGAIHQHRLSNGRSELTLQGQAPSNELIARTIESFPDAKMKELRWEDDSFTSAVPAAQVTQLPAPLQEHLRRLLGEATQTVGYWFGNISLPGQVNVPIGPWKLSLDAQPEQGDHATFLIRIIREAPEGGKVTEILSNAVRGQVGKPIIIGYNRDRSGTHAMGALVVLPEVDTTSAR
ncbi:MAG: hypothetical protein JW993_20620 [Sedimentisphaerales bacterium]|nr:hypothetical protein [Sedimentisphaerales bacterium]